MARAAGLTVLILVLAVGAAAAHRAMKTNNNTVITVESRVAQYGATADARWKPFFAATRVAYPPQRLVFACLKDDAVLEVYAAASVNGELRFVRSLPVLAASGGPGPKLREGDGQVPEGVYAIELLNPTSRYHLSLRVGYPNDFDRRMAQRDGRTQLGGDIMIHGSNVSIGCLAMGDEAAEDLFVLAARTGLKKISVVIAPTDFRAHPQAAAPKQPEPAWLPDLYAEIERALAECPAPARRPLPRNLPVAHP